MRHIKTIAIFILILTLFVSLLSVAEAKPNKHGGHDDEDDNDDDTRTALSGDVETLQTLGLLRGAGKDGLSYEYTHSKPTRIQGFIIYLRLINKEAESDQFSYKDGDDNFDDHHGNSDYVRRVMAYAKAHPELNWVGSNGRFNPMAHLTAREYAKIMLTALGYRYDGDFAWKNVESFAEGLGLNVPEGAFTVEELASMTVQTLYMTMKDSGTTLIDYLASVNPDFAAKVALLGSGGSADAMKPTVTDVILSAPYVAGSPALSGQVTIYFSEAIKSDLLSNKANYTVDLDGTATAYGASSLALMDGSAASASADKKSVTLTIPGSALAGGDAAGAGITSIAINGLQDLAGNTLDPVTAFVRKSSVLTVVSCAAVDVNKLQVTFSNPLKTVDPTEFRLYRSDGFTLAVTGTGAALDSTGRILTVTLSGSLTATAKAADADITAAKLAIGAAVTKDFFGNAVSGAAAVPAVSVLTPATVVIFDKIAPSVSSVNKGTAANMIELNFTEPVNAVDQATLSSALKIRSHSGALQTAAYTFSGSGGTINSFTRVTATIAGGTSGQYSVELLGQGILDLSGNIVRAFAKTTVTLTTSDSLQIVSAETQDLNLNGHLDAVKLTFNKNISDSTVNANNFDVAGFGFEAFYPNTAGDAPNDAVIFITFPEAAAADTGTAPTVTYTQGSLADLTGGKLASTGAIVTTDKAAPAVMTALPAGALTAGGATASATLVLSEDITEASRAAVLAAIQAKVTVNDLVTTGDITGAYTWTTARLLTVSITGNTNGGINPDSIVLAPAASSLVDAAGNIATAQVVR